MDGAYGDAFPTLDALIAGGSVVEDILRAFHRLDRLAEALLAPGVFFHVRIKRHGDIAYQQGAGG